MFKNSGIVGLLLAASVSLNIWFGYKNSNIALELSKREMAQTVIESNYYGLFNWIKTYNENIQNKSKRGGFFSKLFGEEGHKVPDLSKWEDPYDIKQY